MAIFSIGNNIYSTVYTSGQPAKSKTPEGETATSGTSDTLKSIAEIAEASSSPVLRVAGQVAGKLLNTTA